jgi:molecular chaperone DnaJ
MKRDYYDLLGVGRRATNEDIKRAYRRLAVKYHPDQNPGDASAEERFKEVSEAFAVLGDAQKRRRYDHFGHSAFGGPRGGGRGFEQFDFGAVSEMFEGIFGEVLGGRRDTATPAPRDLSYELTVSFVEAALGTKKEIAFERGEPCSRCQGSRAEPGTHTEPCPACRGRGEVRFQRGIFSAARPCSACGGSGVRVQIPCADCNGTGTVKREVTLDVRVPPGVEDGAVRTIRGEGERLKHGSGNLHVNVRVKEHPLFERDGADIVCEVPVSFPQAALGAEIDIPTLDGKVKMKLPAGTQSARVFRLRGKGLPVFGGYGKGDQLVRVLVEVPERVSDRQRELLEQLAGEMSSETHPQQKSFMSKLKELFGSE